MNQRVSETGLIYSAETINNRLFDIGNEIADQIFMNYEKMGMDSEFKRKRYPIIAMELIHSIEHAYNRALGGEERKSLREGRTVIQSDSLGGNYQPQRKKQLFRPTTWGLN